MPRPLMPCGTWAAYQRHKRHGEDACPACMAASMAAMRAYRSRHPRTTPRPARERYPARQDRGTIPANVPPPRVETVPPPLPVRWWNLPADDPLYWDEPYEANDYGPDELRGPVLARIPTPHRPIPGRF